MSPHDDIRDALGDHVPPEERDALLRLADALERERPLPTPAFRGALRRRLLADGKAPPTRSPRRLRSLAAACAGSGAALLAIAAIGVAGAGPFAA